MEENGLPIRARTPTDKRRSSLYLTPEGERLMREMYVAAMSTETVLHEQFAPGELQMLFTLLERAYDILVAEDGTHA